MSFSLPTLVIFFSCRARNTLACAERLISPISSKKIVPLSAASNLPTRSFTAEVKDPLMCPNSSLSISSDGIAAQLTSIIGCAARSLPWCKARATSSFPEPLGPVMSTRTSVGATLSIISLIFCMAALLPIIGEF